MRSVATSVGLRLVGLSIIWWAMVEGDSSVLHYGLLLVPLSLGLSLVLSPPRDAPVPGPRRVVAIASLAGWFLWQSLRGGVDVARRAMSRPVDLDPGTTRYAWQQDDPRVRVVTAGLGALMPGSLSVDVGPDDLEVHVLDRRADVQGQLAELERRVAAALGRR